MGRNFFDPVLIAALVMLLLASVVTAEKAILVWHAYDTTGNIGNRTVSSQRCSSNAGDGWIQGGCPVNRTFALICYDDSAYADLATQYNFSTSIRVMRAELGGDGVPKVTIANTWSDFLSTNALVNTIQGGGGYMTYWTGCNGQNVYSGYNCDNWQDDTTAGASMANANCNYFAASNNFCIAGNYGSGCTAAQAVFCGCYVDAVQTGVPTSSPSRTPSRSPSRSPSPPSLSPTKREVTMVSTTVTPGGCGASTPDTQPFVKGDGSCTPTGFNTAVRALCTGSIPVVTVFTNDNGTCSSPTNTTMPVACRSVTGPAPFGGTMTLGFGLTCSEFLPENLLQVTVFSGSCNARSDPMVEYMVLDTCLMPPGLPIGGTIVRPPVSFRLQAYGNSSNVFVKVQSWTNGVCQGGASMESTITLEAGDGGAVVGCVEGNQHGFTGIGKDMSRRLSTVATEFKLVAVSSNLPTSPSSAEHLCAKSGSVLSLALSMVTIFFLVGF